MARFLRKVKLFFKKVYVDIKKTPNKKSVILCSTLLFVSLSLTFVAGIFSKKTEFEVAGHQISEIVKNNTKDGKYSYMLVESINKEKPLPRTVDEYRFWFDIFRDCRNNYFGVVNGNKEHDLYSLNFNKNKPLTFIYADVFSNVEYNGHWKHEYYHIELMFKGNHDFIWGEDIYSFCYITESQAREILCNDSPAPEDYESLLGTKLQISLNGDISNWCISNIILENNDVTECAQILFDNWILTYNKIPNQVSKQFCYVSNTYDFQNMYKLEYMHNNFGDHRDYLISYGINNLNATTQYENIVTVVQNNLIHNIFIEIALVVLSLCLFLCFVYVFCMKKCFSFLKNSLFIVIAQIFPYLIFLFIHKMSNSFLFFSYTGLTYYFVFFCISFIVSVILFFHQRRIKE